MSQIDHLDLLSLIIALSAYVGGVRLVVYGRIGANPAPSAETKQRLKNFLRLLIPADAALIVSASCLFVRIFWDDLFGGAPPAGLDPVIVWSFFIGVIVLILHHAASWIKSLVS